MREVPKNKKITNAEYYDIDINGKYTDEISFDERGNIVWCQDMKKQECKDCMFRNNSGYEFLCIALKRKWLLEEHDDRIRISDIERTILRSLDKKWKYIAMDEYGRICIFDEKPTKINGYFKPSHDFQDLNCFGHGVFGFLNPDDTEAIDIEYLLNHCIIFKQDIFN